MWKKLISKVDLEEQPPVLSWSYAHAGSCTKVCWTQLRISEQNGIHITQSFYSLFGWPSWRIIWSLLENREKSVSRSHWPTRHLVDRELFGQISDDTEQCMPSASGKTNEMRSPYWELQTRLSCWKQSKNANEGFFRMLLSLGDLTDSKSTSRGVWCFFGNQIICASFMVLQETDNCAAWQHRSRKYLMRCQSAKGRDPRSEFMGHSHWRVGTALSKTMQYKKQF